MLHLLPTEIALQTISHLPLHSLHSITLVSRDWNALIAVNEPTVYRNAAILHRFIDGDQFGAGSIPVSWRDYCRRQLEIERGWRGKAPSVIRELTATKTMVHRIKVDYELGFVITTCQTGGLFVCDIKSNRILWALPQSHVVPYAHLEYGRGYIIFNRHDSCKEVWRRAIDADNDQDLGVSPPDKQMLDAFSLASENYDSRLYYWGHFKPYALLCLPENSRAFRFSYPTLLAAAANSVYIWDITRLQLISVIRDIQRQHHGLSLSTINYVEINDQYVFICGSSSLRIFARDGGALLYQLSTRELTNETWNILPQTPGLPSSVVHPQMLLQNHHSPVSFHGEFLACHVSASGDNLAALTTNGRLVILPGFQRLFAASNAVHHRNIAVILNFQPFSCDETISRYLAVGGRNGKIAVATRKGIYVISPDLDFTRLTAERPTKPGVSVCRLSKFESDPLLLFVTCLQITHDAIYFTYKPSPAPSSSLLETTHHAHMHVPGGFGLPDGEGFLEMDEAMGDGPGDIWEDEELDDDEGEFDPEEFDDVHPIIHNLFLPTSTNTVYSISF